MTETDKRVQFEEEEELSPREKAAILMVALGKEAAGEVMKHLADFEIEEMTQIITELKNLPTAIQDRVLEEFEQHLLAGEWVSQGGALKAASDEVKDKILGNMSERVRDFIEEEMEFLGPMRLSEVEDVQLRVVQKVRQLEEQGQVNIVRGATDDQFV